MSRHSQPSPLAGSTITVDMGNGPQSYRVEDWADRVLGSSWSFSPTPAAFIYSLRTNLSAGPLSSDDEVLYGKDDAGFGHLVHVSEVLAQKGATA